MAKNKKRDRSNKRVVKRQNDAAEPQESLKSLLDSGEIRSTITNESFGLGNSNAATIVEPSSSTDRIENDDSIVHRGLVGDYGSMSDGGINISEPVRTSEQAKTKSKVMTTLVREARTVTDGKTKTQLKQRLRKGKLDADNHHTALITESDHEDDCDNEKLTKTSSLKGSIILSPEFTTIGNKQQEQQEKLQQVDNEARNYELQEIDLKQQQQQQQYCHQEPAETCTLRSRMHLIKQKQQKQPANTITLVTTNEIPISALGANDNHGQCSDSSGIIRDANDTRSNLDLTRGPILSFSSCWSQGDRRADDKSSSVNFETYINKDNTIECNRATSEEKNLHRQNCEYFNINNKLQSQCSEWGAPSQPSRGILNLLKDFLYLRGSATKAGISETSNYSKPADQQELTQTHRLPNCKCPIDHYNYFINDNRLYEKGITNDTIEWREQVSSQGTKSNDVKDENNNDNTSSMPNQPDYRSIEERQQCDRNRRRPSANLASSSSRRIRQGNGYLRLGESHYKKDNQAPSLLQELKRVLLLLVIIAICGVILWQIYEVLIDEEANYLGVVKDSPSLLGHYHEYAVSTDAKPCAEVGQRLLAKGGHAVDAAIGTLICMGVVLPNSLGLGGGCLMTIYDNVTKQAIVIDGREQAPDYAHEHMFDYSSNQQASSRGPLSIGVPGELAAYWEAHKMFGKLKWNELFDESIAMAEKGSPTVEHLAYALKAKSHSKFITEPLKKILWNNQTNAYVDEGELLIQPVLAKTLEQIRDHGADVFYKGSIGQMFIDDLKEQGGQMTMENLSKYKALVKNATLINLDQNMRVFTQPLPGSGIVLSIILRIMRDLGYLRNEQPKQSFEAALLYYHHLTEAFKFAYAQRAALEDSPDDPKRMESLLARLESDEFIRDAVAKINSSNGSRTLNITAYGGLEYFQEDHGTAHTSVIDTQGNCVAVTTSVNLYFGSGLVSPRTGIIYNDVMDDFVSPNITNKFQLLPSKFNRIRPGRRPLSSMAPSVFVDGLGRPLLVLGASGGSKITTAIASVSMRNLFLNEDIKTAIDGPRLHHQFLPDKLWFEQNFPTDLLYELKQRGHQLQMITGRSSVVMAIACQYADSHDSSSSSSINFFASTNGTTSASNGEQPPPSNGTPYAKLITANSDYRKGGSVGGY